MNILNKSSGNTKNYVLISVSGHFTLNQRICLQYRGKTNYW
jgi:hypothetical protein